MATAFDNLAPRVMRDLVRDLGITPEQAAGICGNAGAESGFLAINERRPTVPGSRGGFGWFQWTAGRRVALERWCREKGLDPTSYEANYGFLIVELKSTEAKALQKLRLCKTAKASAETFEHWFERAAEATKNWPKRVKYAERALALYRQKLDPLRPVPVPQPTEPAVPPVPKPPLTSRTIITNIVGFLASMGVIWGLNLTPEQQALAVTIITALWTVGSSYFRASASQPIAGTQAAETVTRRYEDALNTPAPGQEAASQGSSFFPFPFPNFGGDSGSSDPASPSTSLSFGALISAFIALNRMMREHPELKEALKALLDLVMSQQRPPVVHHQATRPVVPPPPGGFE